MNSKKQRQTTTLVAAMAVVAVVVLVAVIALSGRTTAAAINFDEIPQSRTEDGAFVLGNPDAPITLVEFADYACPHCQTYKSTMDRFMREYVATGQAKFEFRTFPTAGGAITEFAGRIAECVEEVKPGSFWHAYELFYQLAMSGQYSQNMGSTVAERLDVPYNEVLECHPSAQQVTTDVSVGRNAGVGGTPAIMVRYGDGELTYINLDGRTYNQGAVDWDVISQVVQQAQG